MFAKKIFQLFLIFASFSNYAQNVTISSVTNQKGKLIISYTIAPNIQGEKYNLQLYSSHNNYASPVTFVEGDIGRDIMATGTTLTVIWDAAKELKTFTGQLQVEVKGTVSYLPIHSDMVIPTTKTGNSIALRWKGGENNDQIKMDLYNGGVYYRSLGTIDNTRSYEWFVPKDVGKGKSFQVKLTNTSKTSESYLSDPFIIKKKGGATWVIIPLAAGAGVGAYFLLRTDPEESLPNPPEPPAGN